jgi:hypothetical protein
MAKKKIYFRVMISAELGDGEAEYETHEVVRQIQRSGWQVEEIIRLGSDTQVESDAEST